MLANLIRWLAAFLLVPLSCSAAQIVVINADPPGQGFNDPTPAVPVGGNPGITVGQQALNVFQRAADTWGAKLDSTQPISVIAFFTPLPCTDTTGILGEADALWYFAGYPPANGGKPLQPFTWYPAALAEKITRTSIVPGLPLPWDIFALFNSALGAPGCLTGLGWYYGFDHSEPVDGVDLLAVVLHEFGHGLGFIVNPTNNGTGEHAQGIPSIWESFVLDTSSGKRWVDMSDGERAASARNTGNLVWAGQHGSNVIPSVLDFRVEVKVANPSSLGASEAQGSQFGPRLDNHGVGGALAGPAPQDGCAPFAPNSLAGKVALIDRGNCTFVAKVKNAQVAGAIAAIVANNEPEGLPGMLGIDPSITIPSVGVTQALGTALRAALPSVFVQIATNPQIRTGTTAGYPRLYAPSSFAPTSNVSHWDVSLTPNVLMEPFINRDLTSALRNPDDLTLNLLHDIGW